MNIPAATVDRVRRRRRPWCRAGAKCHSAIASGGLADAAVRLRRAELGRGLHGSPSLIGMSWKPIAALSPWVKRTKYCIDPESSMPTAYRERE